MFDHVGSGFVALPMGESPQKTASRILLRHRLVAILLVMPAVLAGCVRQRTQEAPSRPAQVRAQIVRLMPAGVTLVMAPLLTLYL